MCKLIPPLHKGWTICETENGYHADGGNLPAPMHAGNGAPPDQNDGRARETGCTTTRHGETLYNTHHTHNTYHTTTDNIQTYGKPVCGGGRRTADRPSNSKDRRISQYSVTIMRKYYDLTKIDIPSYLMKIFTKTAPTFEVVRGQTLSLPRARTRTFWQSKHARWRSLSLSREATSRPAGNSCGPFARVPVAVGLR